MLDQSLHRPLEDTKVGYRKLKVGYCDGLLRVPLSRRARGSDTTFQGLCAYNTYTHTHIYIYKLYIKTDIPMMDLEQLKWVSKDRMQNENQNTPYELL